MFNWAKTTDFILWMFRRRLLGNLFKYCTGKRSSEQYLLICGVEKYHGHGGLSFSLRGDGGEITSRAALDHNSTPSFIVEPVEEIET